MLSTLRRAARVAAFSSRRFANFKSSSSNGGGGPKLSSSISARELRCGIDVTMSSLGLKYDAACFASEVWFFGKAALPCGALGTATSLGSTSTTTCCKEAPCSSWTCAASSPLHDIDSTWRLVFGDCICTRLVDDDTASWVTVILFKDRSEGCCCKCDSEGTEQPSAKFPIELILEEPRSVAV